jgi:hypothetical protein
MGSYVHPTGVRIIAPDGDAPRQLDQLPDLVTINRRLPTAGPSGPLWAKVPVCIRRVESYAAVIEVSAVDADGVPLPESYAVHLHDVAEILIGSTEETTF